MPRFSQNQLNKLCAKYAELEARSAANKQAYLDGENEIAAEKAALFGKIETVVRANPDKVFTEGKSARIGEVVLRMRKAVDKFELFAKSSWESVVSKAGALQETRGMISQTIDRKKLPTLSDEILKMIGLKRVKPEIEENFYIDFK